MIILGAQYSGMCQLDYVETYCSQVAIDLSFYARLAGLSRADSVDHSVVAMLKPTHVDCKVSISMCTTTPIEPRLL